MVRFLVILSYLLSTQAHALTVSGAGVGTITVGGRVLSTSGLIVLHCRVGSTNRCTMRKGNATAGYQVTAGKTLTIEAVQYQVTATSGNSGCQLAYGDNDVGFPSNTVPTNIVYLAGVTNLYFTFNASIGPNNTNYGNQEGIVQFDVPAGKYPAVTGDATAYCNVTVFGHES